MFNVVEVAGSFTETSVGRLWINLTRVWRFTRQFSSNVIMAYLQCPWETFAARHRQVTKADSPSGKCHEASDPQDPKDHCLPRVAFTQWWWYLFGLYGRMVNFISTTLSIRYQKKKPRVMISNVNNRAKLETDQFIVVQQCRGRLMLCYD